MTRIWSTAVVAVLVAILCGLGVWQLQRREWKHQLVTQLEQAGQLPPVSPNEFLRAMMGEISIQYRRADLPCTPGRVKPYDIKGGSNRAGDGGFYVLVSCRPNGGAPDIVAVAGWSRRPDVLNSELLVDTNFSGVIIERPYGDDPQRPRFMLIPDAAVPPLLPARQPTPDGLPDNHLAYAGQWFGLAGALAFIYWRWLRRRSKVAPPAPSP